MPEVTGYLLSMKLPTTDEWALADVGGVPT
jgi:hypothetical protein